MGSPKTSCETDGGYNTGIDEEILYDTMRSAVEDALLNVLGTLFLLGISLVLVFYGAIAAASALSGGGIIQVPIAIGLIGFGFYLAAATLEFVPSIRDLL